jgi:VanZ family protein
MRAWIYRWGPAILFMAIIFFASATPGSEIPTFGYWDFFAKKGGHMLGYALLAAAFCHALNKERGNAKLRIALAVCLTVLYAASDEWHQKFTSGRNASLVDVGIDTVGSLIGVGAIQWVKKRFHTAHSEARTYTA